MFKDEIEPCFSEQSKGLAHITIQPISSEIWHRAGISNQSAPIVIKDQEERVAKSLDRHKVLDEKDLDEVAEEKSDKKSAKYQTAWAVKTLQGINCMIDPVEFDCIVGM